MQAAEWLKYPADAGDREDAQQGGLAGYPPRSSESQKAVSLMSTIAASVPVALAVWLRSPRPLHCGAGARHVPADGVVRPIGPAARRAQARAVSDVLVEL